ncbi:hypothetical protein Salat_2296900 [Sesamum alatum]|uniref:Uncharacterized protein n=1 Tax=Sesamum alatum TaxID=300844 RepID=A0AAE1XVI8_9LAMI|nr:hypothetical protein Salat_2296900 [Sesamum alatum]
MARPTTSLSSPNCQVAKIPALQSRLFGLRLHMGVCLYSRCLVDKVQAPHKCMVDSPVLFASKNMHYLRKTTTCNSASVFLSLIHATTVSMWQNGVYYQSVDSLVEHSRSGLFHPDRPSIHAVMCSLYDVNKTYGTKVVYEWAQTRVERLRERYHLFSWVVNTEGIIWNARLGLVTGPNHVWQSLYLNVAAPQEGWVLRPPPRHVEAGDNAPNAEDDPVVVPDEAGAAEVAPHGPNNEPVPDGLHAA